MKEAIEVLNRFPIECDYARADDYSAACTAWYKNAAPIIRAALEPKDVEGLKKCDVFGDGDSAAYMGEVQGWNAAIDHLSPRILKPGFVMVPEEPTGKLLNVANITTKQYKSMIRAAKEGGDD